MDVGNYISELLAQNGEVSVPGLGYFAHTRVNGYYNEREGKFYPPTYSVQFDPQLIEDDTLANYIAEKKNISAASAKYFTEKYINSLKLQAQTDEAALADLGWFYLEQGRLFFSPNTNQSTDPHFFGYEPVAINKIGQAPAAHHMFDAPVSQQTPAAIEQETVAIPNEYPTEDGGLRYETEEEHEAYLVELTRKRKRRTGWTFAICLIVALGIALFLVNRYDPTAFRLDSYKPEAKAKDSVINAKVVAPPEPVEDTTSKDTMKTVTQPSAQTALPAKTDTVAKNTVPVKDSVAAPRYEILGGSFATTKKAEQAVAAYKRKGVTATIVDLPGSRMHRVSLGSFVTKAEAQVALNKILKTGKVKASDVYIQPPNVKR